MTDYIINVSKVEDLQMINDVMELNRIFSRARSTVVQGGRVMLVRENGDGSTYRFDEITTEADVRTYKETVYKYL